MPIELKEEDGGKLASVRLSGKLAKHDYEHFVPEVEAMIKAHGKIDVLLNMHEFYGWDAGALWKTLNSICITLIKSTASRWWESRNGRNGCLPFAGRSPLPSSNISNKAN